MHLVARAGKPEVSLTLARSEQSVPPRRGSLGARIKDRKLLLPIKLYQWLEQQQVSSIEGLVAYLATFPSALAGQLGWSAAEVQKARNELVELLRSHLPDEIASPPAPPRRGRGAR